MQPHERLAAVDPQAGDWVASLRASAESQPEVAQNERPTNGQRGWMVSELDKACGGTESRHAFLWAATGSQSSKDWTLAFYDALKFWYREGGEELLPRIARAALIARSDDDLAAGKARMDDLLEKAGYRKENDMANINWASVLLSVQGDGYETTGDMQEVLGPLDEYEGTIASALNTLRQAANSADQAPPTPGGPKAEIPDVETAAQEARQAIENEGDVASTERDIDPKIVDDYYAECSTLPESPVIAWTRFQRRQGGPVWSITFRAGLPPKTMGFAINEVMRATLTFEKWLHKHGGSGVIDGRDQTPGFNVRIGKDKPTTAPSPAPPQTANTGGSAPPPPPQAGNGGGQAPPSAPGGNGDSDYPSGTDILNKITVDADGKVEFHVGSFRWPFKDARGGEVVAGLFDESLGWTPAHFVPGAKYEGDAVAGLVVDWEKPRKYYDVVRVHRKGE